jgi:DNA-binding MarR family transcriptional regulator
MTALDPTRQQAWHTFVSLSTRLAAAVDTRLARECQMTHFEFRVLSTLSSRDRHRLQLSALAAAVDASPSRLSHALAALERRDLLQRTEGNRYRTAVLTPAGYEQITAAKPVYFDAVRSLALDALDDEQVEHWLVLTSVLLRQTTNAMACGACTSPA